eukprot:SAG22_NODE_3275_length_1811_cov_2.363902_2_plen_161_part_01
MSSVCVQVNCCYQKLEELGVLETGSRIVANGLKFLEKEFAELEAAGTAPPRKPLSGGGDGGNAAGSTAAEPAGELAASPGGGPQKEKGEPTPPERMEAVVADLMDVYTKLDKVEVMGGEPGVRTRLRRYYKDADRDKDAGEITAETATNVELFASMVKKRF